MNKLLVPLVATAVALTTSTAFAGGPVLEEGQPEVIEEKAGSGFLPLLLIPLILCIALCGNGDDDTPPGDDDDDDDGPGLDEIMPR